MSQYRTRLAFCVAAASLVAFLFWGPVHSPRAQDAFDADEAEAQQPSSLIEAARSESNLTALGLTAEQRATLDALVKDFDAQAKLVRDDVAAQRQGITSIVKRAELVAQERTRIDEIRKPIEQRILEALSEAQVAQLRQMAGTAAASTSSTASTAPNSSSSSSPGSSSSSSSSSSATTSSNRVIGSGTEKIASFGPAETSAPAKTPAAESVATTSDVTILTNTPKVPRISFQFQNAPWTEVLKLFADAAGLTLNLRDTPPGSFTYFDDRVYTPTQALDVMNRYLLLDGYVLVRNDRFLIVFNASKGVPPNLVQSVSLEDLSSRGDTEFVRVTFPLGERDAAKTAAEIRPLLGPQGQVVPLESSNSLVVTDVAGNLRKLRQFIEPPPKIADEQMTFRSFFLENFRAEDAAAIIRNLFNLQVGVRNVSSAQGSGESSRDSGRSRRDWRSMLRERFGGGDGQRDGNEGDNQQESGTPEKAQVFVGVESRLNALFVRARHADMKIIEEAIEALEGREGVGSAPNLAAHALNEPYLEVYELKSASTEEVARTLGVLHPHNVINEDRRSDRIHIWATAEEHKEIAAHIRQLDGAVGSGDSLVVLPLNGIDPYELGPVINALYARDGMNAPAAQIDPSGNNIILRGTVSQIAQIRTLLEQYGASNGTAARGQSGPIRRFRLDNPDEVARILKRIWSATNSNPIKVLTPQNSRESASPEQPSDRTRDRENAPEPDRPRTDARLDERTRPNASPRVFVASQFVEDSDAQHETAAAGESADDAGETAAEKPANRQPPADNQHPAGSDNSAPSASDAPAAKDASETESTPPDAASNEPNAREDQSAADQPERKSPAEVVISVENGEIVVASEDEEALNRIESLIGRLARQSAGRTQWKVFYLRTADAAATAVLLGQFLPVGSTVEAPTPNVFTTITGPSRTLRIIPETRMNALFVSGPPDQVQDVENMLRVLDSDELPPSLRDRVPRMIPVRYADVNEVAQIVRDVYQGQMQQTAQQSSRREEFFRRLRGEDSTAATAPATPVRLTIGVDTRTSQLVVSCDEPTYREIQQLVEALDDAALNAQRVVRVVPSDNSSIVAQTLDSLFPQITISTSSTASPTTQQQTQTRTGASATSNGGDRSDSGDSDRAERMRRFFERMREFSRDRDGGRDGGDRGDRGSRDRGGERGGRGRD